MTGYALGFFFFWVVAASAAALSLYLIRTRHGHPPPRIEAVAGAVPQSLYEAHEKIYPREVGGTLRAPAHGRGRACCWVLFYGAAWLHLGRPAGPAVRSARAQVLHLRR